MAKTTNAEAEVLNHHLGKATPAAIVPWLALFSVAPTDAGGGTELTGGSYARVACTTMFTTTSTGTSANTTAITFPTLTATLADAVAFGLYTASTGGTLKRWALLTAARAMSNGSTPTFAIGTLIFTES